MVRVAAAVRAPDFRGPAGNSSLPELLQSRILVLAPHMDDEALGCGGTMLLHQKKQDVHCLFATDGAASPAPLLPWTGRVDPGLPGLRRQEAYAAAAKLGIPAANLRFLNLPDGALAAHRSLLAAALDELVSRIRPEIVFAPFRYDAHPDHIVLNRAARALLCKLSAGPSMLEYFVYHRLRFVRGNDVRRAIDGSALVIHDTTEVAAAKREALECYTSQTTVRYPWQDRPILTEESLRQHCTEPEVFMKTDPAAPLSAGFASDHRRIQLACFAARFAKRPKDRAVALMQWIADR